MMRFASGLGDDANVFTAVEDACSQVTRDLKGLSCDAVWVFISSHYTDADWSEVSAQIHSKLKPRVLTGCAGSGVIANGIEIEESNGVSIVAAHLPEVKLHPFVISPEELDQSEPGGFWIDKVGASPADDPDFIVFIDPLTVEPEQIIEEISYTYQQRPMLGGLASGGQDPGDHVLFYQDKVLENGAVGIAMTGNISMQPIISQACRPVGRPYVVTDAEENLIYGLAGQSAMFVLHELLSDMDAAERDMAQQGSLFMGIVMDEVRQRYSTGDFFIRNLIGVDPEEGVIAISEDIEIGRTIQFHLRDAETSRQDLQRMLHLSRREQQLPPAGALFFNCIGRGRGMYGKAHQDIRTIRAIGGEFPVGGLFCDGEIGPAGAFNGIHEYTASLALFRPAKVPHNLKSIQKQLGQVD